MQSANPSMSINHGDMKDILIVEDEPGIASFIESRLTSMEYNVVAKSVSAEEAVDNARKYRPDLILMDIRLPGKLDGIDAAEIINSEMKVPIIYLTAWMNDELIDRAKATVPFGYIVKPFHDSELKAMIELALHKQVVEREASNVKNHFRGILDHLNDALISVDFNGLIIFCNLTAENLFGIKADELAGKTVTSLMTGDGSKLYIKRMNEILLCHEPPDEMIIEHICFDDTKRKIVAEVAYVPCRSEDDCFITLVIHDLKTNSAGILPMCAHCKKVRIDDHWTSLEDYFYAYLQVGLTHSICPDCITAYFPDAADTSPGDTLH